MSRPFIHAAVWSLANNVQLQRFLEVKEDYTVRRLLKLLNVKKSGNTVNTRFDLFSSEFIKTK
ncbi:hypothetical protein ACM26V_13260 [Salipaludibacillus sp. HK11]|uniref:hypothetical protein n=1 Tax=Salipaludibacillus sp. HK11 TaxID=3394320 RepID=UPI0039FDABA5